MRIIYLHQYFTTPDMAGGTRSYEMARRLVEVGHEVHMVTSWREPSTMHNWFDTEISGIKVHWLPVQYANSMSFRERIMAFIRFAISSARKAASLKGDVIFATSTPLTIALPGIYASIRSRIPLVFEVRDLWPELPQAMGVVKNPLVLAGMSLLEWMSYRAATACIALAPGIKEGIARRSPKNRRITMIPNGCDLNLFKPGRREDLNLAGIRPNDCVAIFTGAHGMANGLDAVLDAARVLLDRNRKDIVLVFIGDGKLKPHLKERARSEGLENCRFFDPIPKNQLNHLVSCCDIGLMILDDVPAFYYGTSPNKFFDYISSGLPVVNNYPGWLAGMIHEHHCGEPVPPRNPQAFADALCKLADNPELRREYGQNARHLAEQAFSRENLATEFVAFLEINSR